MNWKKDGNGYMMAIEVKERKIRRLNRKKPALRTLNRDTMVRELWDMEEACDDVAFYYAGENDTLLDAILGESEIDADELKTNCSILSAEIGQMLYDMDNPDIFPAHFDKIMAFSGNSDDVLCYDAAEGDYFGCEWNSWDQEDLKKSLSKMTKDQIIDEFRQSFQVALSFVALRARYDDLDCALDVFKGEMSERCRTVSRLNELYEKVTDWRSFREETRKAYNEFERLLQLIPQEEWLK